MPPIPEDQTVLVDLDYLKAYNLPSRGSVEFTPPRFTVGTTIITTEPVVADVDNGAGSIRLIPTNAGTYHVKEMLGGRPFREWDINLGTGYVNTTVALSTLLPATPVQPGVTVNTLLSGLGPPASNVGYDGDYYYEVDGKKWYGPKAAGAWPAGFSVVGPAGTAGAPGSPGAPGANGKTILSGTASPGGGVGTDGDFYLETDVSLLYGPKAAGNWPGGVSLIGPAGAPGGAGPTGPAGPGSTYAIAELYGYHACSGDLDTFHQEFPQNGELWYARILIRAGKPVTKIATFVKTAGVLAAGGVNGFAVASDDGSALLASAQDNNLWTVAGERAKVLASPIAPQPTDMVYRFQVAVQGYGPGPMMALSVGPTMLTEDANKRCRYSNSFSSFQGGGGWNPLTYGFSTGGAIPLILVG